MVREIERIEQPDLVALAHSLRVPLRLEDWPWDYGRDGQTYPCWISFAHKPSNTVVAYCAEGFGPTYPWGHGQSMVRVCRRRVAELPSLGGGGPSRLRGPIAWACRLTPRWSGRVRDKVPSSYDGVRAAQLNR